MPMLTNPNVTCTSKTTLAGEPPAQCATWLIWLEQQLNQCFNALQQGEGISIGAQYRLEGQIALLIDTQVLAKEAVHATVNRLYTNAYGKPLDSNWWLWHSTQTAYPLPFWLKPAPVSR